MLTYRMPRDPSTPRSSVWRQLRRLGVAQLGDGLVALPADARTREQLEWLAESVREADGTAGVWSPGRRPLPRNGNSQPRWQPPEQPSTRRCAPRRRPP